MSLAGGGLLIVALFVAWPEQASARCGDDPGDAQAVADARSEVNADCPCGGGASHGAHVTCAIQVAAGRVSQGLLRPECTSVVKRCAVRSVCGRPGWVTCCLGSPGAVRCRRTRDPVRCIARGGTPQGCLSCCDACTSACPTTSTTMSTTTSTTTTTLPTCGLEGPPLCYGECPPATPICADVAGACVCLAGSTPCGDTRSPECDGVCPAGQVCVTGGADCGCIPVGVTNCLASSGPACGGACPPGVTCTFVSMPDFVGCVCPPTTCGTYPTCGEACPAPKICVPFEGFQSCLCMVL